MSLNTKRLTSLIRSIAYARLSVILLFIISNTAFAQDEIYTILHKNINRLAYDLNHELSASQDSLILNNKHLFHRVRFLNTTTEKIFSFSPRVKQASVSLRDLPLGSYTVMFYQEDKIIVFQIERLLPYKEPPNLRARITAVPVEDSIVNDDIASIDSGIDVIANGLGSVRSKRTRKNNKNYTLRDGGYFSYNLTITDRLVVQSRAEYRRTHLRPNGKPYSD